MAEIITRTFELSLGHRFRVYADWVARRARREAEAARVAPATVVAAKGRAVRAEAGAAVTERARPAAVPSLFRALRPGDRIVKPPSLTTAIPTSPTTTASPRMIPHGPEPVGAIFARRQAAVARMATWLRGDAPSPGPAARPPEASAAPIPPKRTEPEPLADLFARRRAVVKAARPWMRED